MNAHDLLKNYLDENKIPYADIAIAAGIKCTTVKSGLYNRNLSFEKFAKLAVVSGFDVDKNLGAIAETFKMASGECSDKMDVHQDSMANRRIYKRIDELVAEAEEDTSFAVVCKMQKAAEAADKKKESIKWHEDEPVDEAKPIPVPEELPQLVEEVIKHEAQEGKNKMKEEQAGKEEQRSSDNKIYAIDVIRDVVRNMKGMQAVEVAMIIQAIFQYRIDPDVNWLKDARTYLDILIQEHENGWQ